MIILKIGGSVITNKAKKQSFKSDVMANIAKSIKKANKEIIIIHGAGSFGHILAKKFDLNQGFKNKNQLLGFAETLSMVQELNNLVLNALNEQKIPTISISPHNILKLKNHKLSKIDYNIFKDYLSKGFTPVTFGDVALDEKLGFSICSGDLLIEILSKKFRPEKVIFAIDEDGLYTSNPKKEKKAELIKETTYKKLDKLSTSLDSHDDVTGGMGGKIKMIENISKLGIDTILLNGNKADRLFKSLIGQKTTQTIVYGVKK